MSQFDLSKRLYAPGQIVGNGEIIVMLGDSWNGRLDTFWRVQLQFRDALENHLREQGIKATCRIVSGGEGVEICLAGDALKYQSRRRKNGCRKIKKALDGLQQGVDQNALTAAEVTKLDREQRIAVNQYLAVRRCNDYFTLLSSARLGEARPAVTQRDEARREP